MRTNYDNGSWVEIDSNTPAVMLARKEPLHPDDGDEWDADLAPDDAGEFIDVDGIKDIPRDALQRLVLFLIPVNSAPARRWRISTLRLAIIAQMVDPDGIGKQSFEALAKELGCTRALLSWHSLKMIDSLKIDKLRNGKQRHTRETYRQSAIESHRRQGHRIHTDGELTTSATQ
jgi:hypothetical protein